MLNCIAIDDEKLSLDLLADNISKVPYLKLVARCRNAVEAMAMMEQEKIDLLFLDIQMPGLTGLQFAESMTNRPMIIFITAYEKYALDGFNLDVVDYLLKPVSLERFIKACNKARELHQLRSMAPQPAAIQATAFTDHVFVPVEYSQVKVNLTDIRYIEGLKDYIKIHLGTGARPVITRMSLKNIEEKLPPQKFVRIHKSYIVAIAHITSVRKSSVTLQSLELPVSELYKPNIIALTGSV
ncbi:LytR/AlgR family response regulator transcription factor [Foetidibacter luteolus]|uniref:LytR/AlgR family response regulator transcription factor n=1 Tax=Foetidibacter luteolus TaxID=2608880 RepID=UPI00129A0B3A|nr:LytTR family DNA-binding domain-containing protein [Foetidibacter luteolus]